MSISDNWGDAPTSLLPSWNIVLRYHRVLKQKMINTKQQFNQYPEHKIPVQDKTVFLRIM